MRSSRIAGMIERFVDTSGWAEWADRTLIFITREEILDLLF
jgi:hypothetical protein